MPHNYQYTHEVRDGLGDRGEVSDHLRLHDRVRLRHVVLGHHCVQLRAA
jgi:hypothetical protein